MVDPEQLRQAVDILSTMQGQISQIRDEIGTTFAEVKGNVDRVAKESERTFKKAIDEVAKTGVDVSQTSADTMWGEMEGFLDNANVQFRELGKQIKTAFLKGSDGVGGLKDAMSSLVTGVTSGFPVPGIFGMMLYGRFEADQWRARTQQALQIVEQAGPMSSKLTKQINTDMRELGQSITSVQGDIQATAGAFAAAGITAEEMATKTGTGIKGVNDNVITLGLAMDYHFEQAAGTFGQLASTIAVDTNKGIKEAANTVRDIGLAARETGMNFQMMLGAVTQVTSAFRMQGIEARAVSDTVIEAVQALSASGMGGPRAAAVATGAIGGVAQALQGLDIGMKGYLGQQMGATTALGGVRQFETGFRGRDFDEFQHSVRAMLDHVETISPDEDTQYQVLRQLYNLSPDQSETMLAIRKGVQDGSMTQDEAKKQLADLRNSVETEKDKMDEMTEVMNNLRDDIAKIGAAIFDLLITLIEQLTIGLEALATRLNPFASGAERRAAADYQRTLTRSGMSGVGRITDALQGMFETSGSGAQLLLGGEFQSRRDAYNAYIAATTRGSSPTDEDRLAEAKAERAAFIAGIRKGESRAEAQGEDYLSGVTSKSSDEALIRAYKKQFGVEQFHFEIVIRNKGQRSESRS